MADSAAEAVAESCPICDVSLPAEGTTCPTCGFPRALLPEARVAVQGQESARQEAAAAQAAAEAGPGTVVLPFEPSGPTIPPPTSAGLDLEQTAVALQASLRVAQLLGLDTAGVATALASAAMESARGSLPQAKQLLQTAYDQLEPEIGKSFEGLAVELEDQEGRLREGGIAADVAREVARARRSYEEGSRIEAVETLQRTRVQMNELEAAWKQVKETLLRVDTLREVGKKLAMDLSRPDERLIQVRQLLSEVNLSAATLGEAGTHAAAALVLLHEQVRNQIALLGQEAIVGMKEHPLDREQGEKAQARLKQVLSHARSGRLKEAAEEMIQFRATFLPQLPPLGGAAGPAEAAATEAAPAAPTSEAGGERPAPAAAASPSATVPSTPVATSTAVVAGPEASPAPTSPTASSPGPSGSTTPVGEGGRTAPTLAPSSSVPPGTESAPSPAALAAAAVPSATASVPSASPPPAETPAAPAASGKRGAAEIVADARELGAKLKARQAQKKDVRRASTLLKELTSLIKAGKLVEADAKLVEVRDALTGD